MIASGLGDTITTGSGDTMTTVLGDTIATSSGETHLCQLNQCSEPVIDVSVSCSKESNSVKVQWSASEPSPFGFCVQYQCSTDPNLEYCTNKTIQVHMFNNQMYMLYVLLYRGNVNTAVPKDKHIHTCIQIFISLIMVLVFSG